MLLKDTGGEVKTFCFSEVKKTLPVTQETKYRSRIVVVDDDEAGRLNAEQLHTERQSGQHSH